MHRRRYEALLYCAALIFQAVAFHWRVLFDGRFVFPWDFRGVHVPLATFVAESIRRGEAPLWDPYTYCGNPIYANIQTALFYPPAFAASLAGAWLGIDLVPRLLVIVVVLQIALAGVFTFALLRRLGAEPGAAWIAGTMYELGCFFASQAQHAGAVQGAIWLPLIWLCVVELRTGWRWISMAALSVSLAMTALAGLPQVAVAAFGSALALAVVVAAFALGGWRLPLRVLASWVWALLIAAVQLIPTAELSRNSVAKYRAEWLGSGGGIKLGALWSLVIPNHWNLFDITKFNGPGDMTFLYLYSSLSGLALAVGAVCWKPDRWTRVFGVLTGVATLWMLGESTPIGRGLFLALPVSIRIGIHPEFVLCAFSLGLAVLAGLGASRFLRRRSLLTLAGIIITVDLLAVSSGRPFNQASLVSDPGITRDAIDGSRELSLLLHSLTATGAPPYRFDMVDAPYRWSSSAPVIGVPTANGCDPLAPERVIQLRLSFAPGDRWGTCYQVANPSSRAIGLANVRYLVSRSPVVDEHFKSVGEAAEFHIYENSRTLPRFFLVNRIKKAGSLTEAAAMLHDAGFDPSDTAIVEGDQAEMSAVTVGPAGRVDVISYSPAAIALRTQSQVASLLVASETWYPGWEARIDGREARLYAANVAFRGIVIPPGEHRVEMRFAPRILYLSGLVSALAFLASVAACLSSPRAGRSSTGAAD